MARTYPAFYPRRWNAWITLASRSLNHGAKIHVDQATLGHANVATTSWYLQAKPKENSSLYLPE